ncbi:hypothetical protein CLOSYM_01142 [[Clostridium] symbiosum ATCC 14940]|uniref:Uncharacterized protein n=1 Tax=[Clostridium] symbiosum ATCC 14940 TaxID=411472 RepID=A0ABC9U118_CLOSY|nr:hypothetical protein CLOSYM_01142 [[Clostridium] symbiosum ATCC 14940]
MIIITADDDLVRKIEPCVVCSSKRFQMIEELSSRGRYVIKWHL